MRAALPALVATLAAAHAASAQCQLAQLLPDPRPGTHFGLCVAQSGDTLIVGARGAANSAGTATGAAYIYRRQPSGQWALEAKLTGTDSAAGDQFGVSVSLRGDVAAIGAWLTDDAGSGSGSAYIFRRSGTSWTQEAKLLADDAGPGDRVGVSVAIDGDAVLAGAPYTTQAGFNTGAAYVFRHSGAAWAQERKLEAPTLRAGAFFGSAVALEGDLAAVGALGESQAGFGSGAVYLFRHSQPAWAHEATLTALDAASEDALGSSVSISAGVVLAGAYLGPGPAGPNQGAAYLFRGSAGLWSQDAKLLPPEGADNDAFGWSVCLDGDAAIVGAYTGGGIDEGIAYLFRRNGPTWNPTATLRPSDPAAGDAFGISVSLSGPYAAAGAFGHDGPAADSGAAYIFAAAACECYANCDGSTVAPTLNVGDFICFLNLFSAGHPDANCDASTAPPVLNVNDFVCFQTRFALGCP